jgi:phosphoribosylcarboxyaminoimidazole (NCAIR) mutase
LLRKTEAVLAEFQGIRVQMVEVIDHPTAVVHSAWPGRLKAVRRQSPCAAICASSRPAAVATLLALLSPHPLIFIPVADDPGDALRLLQAAAETGAATVALGEAGARNAALLAVAMFAATGNAGLQKQLDAYRARQTSRVLKIALSPI